jgi:hypothetical protein
MTSVRESLPDLPREFGFAVQAFSSAEEFLASDYVTQTRCLILDMPGMSGPISNRSWDITGIRFALVSLQLTEMRLSVHGRSNRVPWSAYSRSTPRFEGTEQWATILHPAG